MLLMRLFIICKHCLCLVLVDRDNRPKWQPSVLEAVSREKVDWYFSPLSEDKELYLWGQNI